jgi:WD40 repeat protein
MFRKKKLLLSKILISISLLSLFAMLVIFLKDKGFIKDRSLRSFQIQHAKEFDKKANTQLKLLQTNLSGKLIYEKDKKLFAYNPSNQLIQEIFSDLDVEHFGILDDNRIYFWQSQNKLYSILYLQNNNYFDKYFIPLKTNDGGNGIGTPPILAPNGEYLLFTSDRDSSDHQFRRTLYRYDLTDFTLRSLTAEKFIDVAKPSISSDSQLIAISYQNPDSNINHFGILISNSPSPNLYPGISLSNSNFIFSSDNNLIALNTATASAVFNLKKGKITQFFADNQTPQSRFQNSYLISQNQTILTKPQSNQSCDKKIIFAKDTVSQFSIYETSYDRSNLYLSKNYSVNDNLISLLPNPISSFVSNSIIVNTLDESKCQQSLALYNIYSQEINYVDFGNIKSAFWIH